MISGIQSALSGAQAFSAKIESNAHNIANLNTEGYRKSRVVLSAGVAQSVQATVGRVDAPGPVVNEETAQGYAVRELSNVDLGEEIPDLMRNTHGYAANLRTVQVSDNMLQTLLDIKA
ncbi:protein of unknown function DUF1078 domain protein [Desulfobulbus propionicus DSM 2032]|jgi:flagellar basal-body rod protein FlgC|uniref:Flagellar biosynthesis protein FlgC n=1 Tax=Desulfobulbus propionicus (strain ATCC 33891 / DSM 2032 / VKM B-1956 / 1pr3) TaxID=577650 RepID=A0A7U3YNQ6_DESPD|nr:flagellar basal body rod C-terminal domain-containing protein [Desulfobulbus propionicus]ADW18749.1 protein of unknown function DUF1078 domain protein [Desulfobulbus propionicus DSM 2032]